MILDGEIIAVRGGRPGFGLLQSRMHVLRPTDRLGRGVPVQLYLFAVLQAGGDLLVGLPYAVRRELLAELGLDTGPVRTVEATTSRERDPRALWCLELATVHTALAHVGATALTSDGRE